MLIKSLQGLRQNAIRWFTTTLMIQATPSLASSSKPPSQLLSVSTSTQEFLQQTKTNSSESQRLHFQQATLRNIRQEISKINNIVQRIECEGKKIDAALDDFESNPKARNGLTGPVALTRRYETLQLLKQTLSHYKYILEGLQPNINSLNSENWKARIWVIQSLSQIIPRDILNNIYFLQKQNLDPLDFALYILNNVNYTENGETSIPIPFYF